MRSTEEERKNEANSQPLDTLSDGALLDELCHGLRKRDEREGAKRMREGEKERASLLLAALEGWLELRRRKRRETVK